ncbi:MAG: hypothetical protein CMJ18_05360 [Phycisphaeraceae bacterium]|nr:hypothetical protein [Phycisphaeraceae bacterium]
MVSAAPAQFAGFVDPPIIAPTATANLNLHEATGNGTLFMDDCLINEVRVGGQNGPVVWTAIACNDVIIPVGSDEDLSVPWTPQNQSGGALPDGQYYLGVRSRSIATGVVSQQWFAVTLSSQSLSPRLQAWPYVFAGVPTVVALDAPGYAGTSYVAAASFSTDTGIDVAGPGLHLALDPDPLFLFTLSEAGSALTTGFQGDVGSTGAGTMTFTVPQLPPEIQDLNLHVQALIGDPSDATQWVTTNVVSFLYN